MGMQGSNLSVNRQKRYAREYDLLPRGSKRLVWLSNGEADAIFFEGQGWVPMINGFGFLEGGKTLVARSREVAVKEAELIQTQIKEHLCKAN